MDNPECGVTLEDKKNGHRRTWVGPRTITVHRDNSGFGFTLRHFIVYPPESSANSQEGEGSLDQEDGSGRKRSKLSSLEPMDTIFVKHVKDEGPAQHAGLQKGDRIVSVNGQSVTGMTYSQVIALIQASDTSLKLLVVPKDEDILQMAYETSAYKQGKEAYRGNATEIPRPPQVHLHGQDTTMPHTQAYDPGKSRTRSQDQPADSTSSQTHQPARFKSEIHIMPGDNSSVQPHKVSGFDPRIPRQRHSASSIGSISSCSSYSTSKDVGIQHFDRNEMRMEIPAKSSEHRTVDRNSVTEPKITAHNTHPSYNRQGSSSTVSSVFSHGSDHPGSSQEPPTAPTRSSSRNITLTNYQSQLQINHDQSKPVGQGYSHSSQSDRISDRIAHVGSVDSLERSCDSPGSRTSDSIPPLEKLLRSSHETDVRRSGHDADVRRSSHDTDVRRSGYETDVRRSGRETDVRLSSQDTDVRRLGHETDVRRSGHKTDVRRSSQDTDVRRSGCEKLRHSSDNIFSLNNGTAEKMQFGTRVSTTHLPPGSSATITLTPQSRINTTSSMQPPGGSQSRSAWESDSLVYNTSTGSSLHQDNNSIHSANNSQNASRHVSHNGRIMMDNPDSYGLTVSLHMDGQKPSHVETDSAVPNASSRRGDRHSIPEGPMVNLVSKRMKKFESAESINCDGPVWRLRSGAGLPYDGVNVHSRAAQFEHAIDRSWSPGHSSLTGSTSSLQQVGPPLEIKKVLQNTPATINFYFRESIPPHMSTARLEPSPERTMLEQRNNNGFRMRVSSEPPESGNRISRQREPSPLTNISISYGDSNSPMSNRRLAARQPSYLTAVSPAKQDHESQFEYKTTSLPLRSSSHILRTKSCLEHSQSPILNWRSVASDFHKKMAERSPPSSVDLMTNPTNSSIVTLRERSRSEDREARLVRRTSYLLATGRQNTTGGYQDPNRVDVSQLVVPVPPSMPTGEPSRPSRLELSSCPLSPCAELPEPLGNPDSRSPSTPRSPFMENLTTPTKTSNIRKLKNLFGERTPRILEAIADKRPYYDLPVAAGGTALEGTLLCKFAITDGKRASDRSWKPCYAQLRGHALYLFKDKFNISPITLEDQPISVKSSIVDIAYDYTKKKNVFRLTTYNGSEYLFQAEDNESMLQWIRVIQANNNPDEDKDGILNAELIVRKSAQQQESTSSLASVGSPQPTQKGKEKKSSTRSLRSKSPSYHSPAPKPKKQLSEKDLMEPKVKDVKTWKDRMAKKFKRYGSSSSTSADHQESTEQPEFTGTFGVPLDLCPCSTFSDFVPMVVEVCCRIVEDHGIDNQGIYRVPGNTGAVNLLQEEFNKAYDYETLDMENEKWMDVNVVSSLLKLFFRKLPDPLITEELYQPVINANRTVHQEKRMLKIKKLLHDLPEHNFETFRHIAEHLNKVSEHEKCNKMDGRNLAIVFGPTLIRTSDDNMVTMVTDMSDQCRIVESIITNYKWFFSSWFEDVNVPIEEDTETVPVSGMNQELLFKAECLGERGREVSIKDIMSSVIQPARRKMRKKDKPKASDSLDIDVESEPNSYNERNIDREIELRKGKDLSLSSHNCLTKDSSLISLEQASAASTGFSLSMSVQESKSSVSLDQGASRDMMSLSSIDLKTSSSSLAGMAASRTGSSMQHLQQVHDRNLPPQKPDRHGDDFPIKRYPAYPRVETSYPQTDNSKPTLLKKYSSEELNRVEWRTGDETSSGEWKKDHDEVKRTYGLTPQTRQHLKRIEQETEALRQKEKERKREQERTAIARQKIEMELQKTKQEMENEQDDFLNQGLKDKADSRSVTSDYSTMSSTNAGASTKSAVNRHYMDYSPVRSSSSMPRELYGSYSPGKTHTQMSSPQGTHRTPGKLMVSSLSSLPASGQGLNAHGDLKKTHSPSSRYCDKPKMRSSAIDDPYKVQSGSLDSLLDGCEKDLSHIDSDEDETESKPSNKEQGLLESIASADPQFKNLLSSHAIKHGTAPMAEFRYKSKLNPTAGATEKTFRDPTLHKVPNHADSRVVGIASRFEHNNESKDDHSKSGYSIDSTGNSKTASRHLKENLPPAHLANSGKSRDQRMKSANTLTKQPKLERQDSGNQSLEQYASSLRKSTEKLFASENLIDLRSPQVEVRAIDVNVDNQKSGSPKVQKASDRKCKRRRYTVGGTEDLEHIQALMSAMQDNSNLSEDQKTATERLQPKSRIAEDVHDLTSWCIQQRLRRAGSTPALNNSSTAFRIEDLPLVRKGSGKSAIWKGISKLPSQTPAPRKEPLGYVAV